MRGGCTLKYEILICKFSLFFKDLKFVYTELYLSYYCSETLCK